MLVRTVVSPCPIRDPIMNFISLGIRLRLNRRSGIARFDRGRLRYAKIGERKWRRESDCRAKGESERDKPSTTPESVEESGISNFKLRALEGHTYETPLRRLPLTRRTLPYISCGSIITTDGCDS